jgi:hypothetical protein
MDPVSTMLISALVAGAINGLKKLGETAVGDAYSALKRILQASYASAAGLQNSVAALEARPDSENRRGVVAEELSAAKALDDRDLIEAAEKVLAAAEKNPELAIGIDWQDVKTAQLRIGEIRARAGSIGFRAARLEVSGMIDITKIDVGGPAGK